jgi:hypothetical protein
MYRFGRGETILFAVVIGGTGGKIVTLDVATLAWTADSEESVAMEGC